MATAMVTDDGEMDIYSDIISGMAVAIKNGDPMEEIRDMIINNGKFTERIKKWKDSVTGLNILQLAVIKGDPTVVNLLKSEFEFDYDVYSDRRRWPKSKHEFLALQKSVLEAKSHELSYTSEEFRLYVTNILKAQFRMKLPLHLACKLGNLEIIKLFLDEDDLELDSLLNEPSLILLPQYGNESPTAENDLPFPEWISDFVQHENRVFEINFQMLQKQQKHCASPRELRNLTKLSSLIEHDPSIIFHLKRCSPGISTNNIEASETFKQDIEASICGVGKTPLQICIEEKHVQCAIYIANLHYQCIKDKINVQVDYRKNRQFQSNPKVKTGRNYCDRHRFTIPHQEVKDHKKGFIPLHIAISLNLPEYLKLLLDNGYSYLVNSKDHAGMPPLYIALHKNTECVELLLRHGARSDCILYHQSPLLWLYEKTETNLHNCFIKNTELLVKYGANGNVKDLNSNTALDYLAAEFSKMLSLMNTTNGQLVLNGKTAAEKKANNLMICMNILLANGAKTSVQLSKLQVHHTVGHTFISNCCWPNTEFMVKCPDLVYSVLELLFQFGLDPNVLPTNNETNLFSQLICNCLSDLSLSMQKKFLILFIRNGASVNKVIPPPYYAPQAGPIRIWNVYPLILALQEKLPVEVLEVMCQFMSIDVLNDCIASMAEGHLWSRIQMLRSNAPPGSPGISENIAKYKTSWNKLVIKISTNTRSLQHGCKLSILNSLAGRSRLVEHLQLPNSLKQYLVHHEC